MILIDHLFKIFEYESSYVDGSKFGMNIQGLTIFWTNTSSFKYSLIL